jgi:hypothetical protein
MAFFAAAPRRPRTGGERKTIEVRDLFPCGWGNRLRAAIL